MGMLWGQDVTVHETPVVWSLAPIKCSYMVVLYIIYSYFQMLLTAIQWHERLLVYKQILSSWSFLNQLPNVPCVYIAGTRDPARKLCSIQGESMHSHALLGPFAASTSQQGPLNSAQRKEEPRRGAREECRNFCLSW